MGPRVVASVEGASVQEPDHECLNGVIHIINKALFPANMTAKELLQQNGSFKLVLKNFILTFITIYKIFDFLGFFQW